jgi:hypothetical protein
MTTPHVADPLLPCPFCGGDAKLIEVNGMGEVCCDPFRDNCDVRPTTGMMLHAHKAIALWNGRPVAAIRTQPTVAGVAVAWLVEWPDAESPDGKDAMLFHTYEAAVNSGFAGPATPLYTAAALRERGGDGERLDWLANQSEPVYGTNFNMYYAGIAFYVKDNNENRGLALRAAIDTEMPAALQSPEAGAGGVE